MAFKWGVGGGKQYFHHFKKILSFTLKEYFFNGQKYEKRTYWDWLKIEKHFDKWLHLSIFLSGFKHLGVTSRNKCIKAEVPSVNMFLIYGQIIFLLAHLTNPVKFNWEIILWISWKENRAIKIRYVEIDIESFVFKLHLWYCLSQLLDRN